MNILLNPSTDKMKIPFKQIQKRKKEKREKVKNSLLYSIKRSDTDSLYLHQKDQMFRWCMFRWLCSLSCCGHVSPPNDIWLDPRSRGRFLEQTATWKCFIATYFCPDISEQACALPFFGLLGWLRTPHNYCPLGWSYMQSHAQTQTYASTQRSSLHIYVHTHAHTHTHTYTLTHTHACTHKSTHKNPKLHREKNLLRTFIGFRKRRTTLPFTWSPAVYTPRGMSKRISKISNFIMKSACTHTPRTEHTVFTLKQVIHNFFF